jgi:hypothetical protein
LCSWRVLKVGGFCMVFCLDIIPRENSACICKQCNCIAVRWAIGTLLHACMQYYIHSCWSPRLQVGRAYCLSRHDTSRHCMLLPQRQTSDSSPSTKQHPDVTQMQAWTLLQCCRPASRTTLAVLVPPLSNESTSLAGAGSTQTS